MSSSSVHLSVRVPWHDGGWSGSICRAPLGNASCILLTNVGKRREDDFEVAHAGKSLDDIDASHVACLRERGTFLSPHPYQLLERHPYEHNSALKGIQPTPLSVPAYGFHSIPYYWMLREQVVNIQRDFDVQYDEALEEEARTALNFTPEWVMHANNQRALITRFFEEVSPQESLVFFYVKHSPVDGARVGGPLLVGAARVTGVELPGPWRTNGRTAFPTHMWETSVRHSLRPDGTGGILLPVAELAERDARGDDISGALAWAPDTGGREFAYVTEHVTHDTAIAALERLFRAAERCREIGIDIPQASTDWVNERIGEIWTSRGPAPGLGAVLDAMEFPHGKLLARETARIAGDDKDPWEVLSDAVARPDRYSSELKRMIPPNHRKMWQILPKERQRVLRLLSRFQLTSEQVRILLGQKETDLHHDDLVDDPYLIHICTVNTSQPISFDAVDRGCYPRAAIAAKFPMPSPSAMDEPGDDRRVQALLVAVLEDAARSGDTLLPLDVAIERARQWRLAQPVCPISEDLLRACNLHPEQLSFASANPAAFPVVGAQLDDGRPAFKLARLEHVATVIRTAIDHQLKKDRWDVPKDLSGQLDDILDAIGTPSDDSDDAESETRARLEKKKALEELFAAPLSVLNGRAGTGKTTLVRALVRHEAVRAKNVLLLAPTGKARVQLQNKTGHPAQTIAQFLLKHKRYREESRAYILASGKPKAPFHGTVIIDESSMLTEEQLGALLDALHLPDRLILVGDPRQLPPIGAGRPFADLIHRLTTTTEIPWFPRVAASYTELTELRRQKGRIREDLMLAAWFSGDPVPKGYDEVWQRLRTDTPMQSLAAVPWPSAGPVVAVERVLADKLQITDSPTFETSYGGKVENGYVNFPTGAKGAAASCENWQILSPTRGRSWGTTEINRHLKRTFRQGMLERAQQYTSQRSVAKPFGAEQIVLGDKVLNNENGPCRVFPSGSGYVANGEIGVVVGRYGRPGSNPREVLVQYSSQTDRVYEYRRQPEDDPTLELAWATTIHKSQGSEFKKVLVLLPAAIRDLSREMLYTALTRQEEQVILLHEGSIDDLWQLTVSSSSETARRLTDLFAPPAPQEVFFPDGTSAGVLDSRRIHLTRHGTLVRSKSEVVIAEILDGIAPGRWGYNQPLTLGGITRPPDFTIMAADGHTIYWEHLEGMNRRENQDWWRQRERWYRDGGVKSVEEGGTLLWTTEEDGIDVSKWTQRAREAIGSIDPLPVAPVPGETRRVRPGKRG